MREYRGEGIDFESDRPSVWKDFLWVVTMEKGAWYFVVYFFFLGGGDDCNDPDLVQAFLKKWWVESDFKAPNLPFHYGSKFTAVIKTVFITILEQNR